MLTDCSAITCHFFLINSVQSFNSRPHDIHVYLSRLQISQISTIYFRISITAALLQWQYLCALTPYLCLLSSWFDTPVLCKFWQYFDLAGRKASAWPWDSDLQVEDSGAAAESGGGAEERTPGQKGESRRTAEPAGGWETPEVGFRESQHK